VTHVPEVVAPPPGNPRFPLMDALRALAALAVLVSHVAFVTGVDRGSWWGSLLANGSQGVTVFFVLSGFLLYRPLVRARVDGDAPPGWATFARRRLLRIVPAYWLALTVLAIEPGLPGVFTDDWWRYYLFLQVYDHNTAIGGLVVAWSLCVEITFYLVLPFYALGVNRLLRGMDAARRVPAELLLLGGLAVVSLVVRWVDFAEGPSQLQQTLVCYLLWFSLGMALAVLSVAVERRGAAGEPRVLGIVRAHPGWCWAGALATYAVLCAYLGAPTAQGPNVDQTVLGVQVLGGLAALLLVVPAVFVGVPGIPGRVLSWRPLVLLGIVSYGVYLWHTQVSTELGMHGVDGFAGRLAGTVALTAAVAALSYVLVERPLLRFKSGGRARRKDPAG